MTPHTNTPTLADELLLTLLQHRRQQRMAVLDEAFDREASAEIDCVDFLIARLQKELAR